MNNHAKKVVKELSHFWVQQIGDLPGGGFTQLGELLRYYRTETIIWGIREVRKLTDVNPASSLRLADSEACFSRLRRLLRERP